MKNGDRPIQYVETDSFANQGLTKREYFAGLAMQGFASNIGCNHRTNSELIKLSIQVADELLKQLEQ